jgi:hypothetical protein
MRYALARCRVVVKKGEERFDPIRNAEEEYGNREKT